MNVNQLFPSKWLKAADLEGRRITAVIEAARMETMEGKQGKHDELVVYFRNSKSGKGLILNQTNAFAIAEHYGPETEGWVGKPIELYATQLKIKGELHDVIRVVGKKAPAGQRAGPRQAGVQDDDAGLWEDDA